MFSVFRRCLIALRLSGGLVPDPLDPVPWLCVACTRCWRREGFCSHLWFWILSQTEQKQDCIYWLLDWIPWSTAGKFFCGLLQNSETVRVFGVWILAQMFNNRSHNWRVQLLLRNSNKASNWRLSWSVCQDFISCHAPPSCICYLALWWVLPVWIHYSMRQTTGIFWIRVACEACGVVFVPAEGDVCLMRSWMSSRAAIDRMCGMTSVRTESHLDSFLS